MQKFDEKKQTMIAQKDVTLGQSFIISVPSNMLDPLAENYCGIQSWEWLQAPHRPSQEIINLGHAVSGTVWMMLKSKLSAIPANMLNGKGIWELYFNTWMAKCCPTLQRLIRLFYRLLLKLLPAILFATLSIQTA